MSEFDGVDKADAHSEAPVPGDKIMRVYTDGEVRGEKITVTLCNMLSVLMQRRNGNDCAVFVDGDVAIVVLSTLKDDKIKDSAWSLTGATGATRKGALKTVGAHPAKLVVQGATERINTTRVTTVSL